MPSKIVLVAVFIAGLFGSAEAASAQRTGDDPLVYRREVFQYQRSGRPDPFRSLLNPEDLGVRFEDLTLHGVVFNPDPRRSVAIFRVTGSDRPLRVRVGERMGSITIAGIQPRRVDLLVTEFGVTRRESLELRTISEQGTNR